MNMSIEDYIARLDEINRSLDACGIPNAEKNAVLLRWVGSDIDYDFSILSDDPLRYCTDDERREILRQCGIEV